ncbi:hypothetical protein [Micromonospora inaquosa]|uniref:hypothetical protein n=1 Tax=Micromonospora inaquosa TaxID=2203716 RepID=UPI000F5E4F8D|nr:hypothetical protein [Micromonospora inaquosa]
MSIADLKATLGAAIESARQGRRTLDLAITQAESATGEAARVLRGSQHAEVTRTHSALSSAQAEVGPTRRRFDAVAEKVGDYRSQLG